MATQDSHAAVKEKLAQIRELRLLVRSDQYRIREGWADESLFYRDITLLHPAILQGQEGGSNDGGIFPDYQKTPRPSNWDVGSLRRWTIDNEKKLFVIPHDNKSVRPSPTPHHEREFEANCPIKSSTSLQNPAVYMITFDYPSTHICIAPRDLYEATRDYYISATQVMTASVPHSLQPYMVHKRDFKDAIDNLLSSAQEGRKWYINPTTQRSVEMRTLTITNDHRLLANLGSVGDVNSRARKEAGEEAFGRVIDSLLEHYEELQVRRSVFEPLWADLIIILKGILYRLEIKSWKLDGRLISMSGYNQRRESDSPLHETRIWHMLMYVLSLEDGSFRFLCLARHEVTNVDSIRVEQAVEGVNTAHTMWTSAHVALRKCFERINRRPRLLGEAVKRAYSLGVAPTGHHLEGFDASNPNEESEDTLRGIKPAKQATRPLRANLDMFNMPLLITELNDMCRKSGRNVFVPLDRHGQLHSERTNHGNIIALIYHYWTDTDKEAYDQYGQLPATSYDNGNDRRCVLLRHEDLTSQSSNQAEVCAWHNFDLFALPPNQTPFFLLGAMFTRKQYVEAQSAEQPMKYIFLPSECLREDACQQKYRFDEFARANFDNSFLKLDHHKQFPNGWLQTLHEVYESLCSALDAALDMIDADDASSNHRIMPLESAVREAERLAASKINRRELAVQYAQELQLEVEKRKLGGSKDKDSERKGCGAGPSQSKQSKGKGKGSKHENTKAAELRLRYTWRTAAWRYGIRRGETVKTDAEKLSSQEDLETEDEDRSDPVSDSEHEDAGN